MKRKLAGLLVCALCLTLSACGSDGTAVYVQSVERLAAMGGIAPGNRFLGMVVSEHTAEINRDADKTIAELLVKEGDDVTEGQALFSYDTEELQLNLDKKNLELQQLKSSIETYKQKIATLEKERDTVSGTARLQYTVEIQSAQVDQKEAELKLKTKEDEVKKAQELLDNSTVVSPITGRVQKINESDTTGSDGKPAAYIVIQQSGSYRVKGVLNELQRGAIMEGDRILLTSRLDENETWTGTVSLVDYDNPVQGSNSMYMESDEMGNSSRYPFYVELDSSDGMLLGQHLYMTVTAAQEPATLEGTAIGSAFVCYDEDGTAYVWADNGQGKLEKRTVELGMYDPMTDTQEILDGLTDSDFVAFPSELCQEGAPTSKVQSSREGGMNP